jgi:hypothetical protein
MKKLNQYFIFSWKIQTKMSIDDSCDNESGEIDDEHNEFTDIILTRYLYSKIDVKQSLLLALLEHQPDEAMFWAYELYYSGFQQDCFDYVSNIYEEIYSFDNSGLQIPFQKIIAAWSSDHSLDWNLGTIIMTLASRNYSLNYFMKTYFDMDCVNPKKPESKNNLIIYLKEKDIEKYKTVVVDRPWMYLRTACKYAIRKEANDIFKYIRVSREDFIDHWLYYCKDTPFWVDKIVDCDGEIDDENKEICFADEDLKDAFYDAWNVDADEQPLEIIEQCIGKPDLVQMSLLDFAKKYGAIPLLKKMKISIPQARVIQNVTFTMEDTSELTNSISYT